MKITFVLVLVAFLRTSNQQCLSPRDDISVNSNRRFELYTGQQGFSLDLLQAFNQLMPNENLFFSPYSIYHGLLTAYFLAGGQTERSLNNMLRLDPSQTKFELYQQYKLDKFITQLKKRNSSYEFTNVNKIYVTDQANVRLCIYSLFQDELLNTAPFKTDPQGARNTINNWVKKQTHHMIKDLLPPGSIDQSSTLVLVTAAYFRGEWENKFNPEETTLETFYVTPSKQINVHMMHGDGTFNHDVSESLEAHILEIPYEGGDDHISMFILLPPFTKEDAIDKTLKKLTVEKFQNIVNSGSLTPKIVQVAFPKFSLEHTIELVPVLKKLGIGDDLQGSANFSRLTTVDKLSLGNPLHKAKIEVNEEGTKDADATLSFSFRSRRPTEPAVFYCNHPFIYFIYNKVQKAVLFTGVFRQPH